MHSQNVSIYKKNSGLWFPDGPLKGGHTGGSETDDGTLTGASLSTLFAAVPSNHIYIVQAIATRNSTRAITRGFFYHQTASVGVPMLNFTTPAAAHYATWTGELYLIEGEQIGVFWVGGVAGDAYEFKYSYIDINLETV